MNKYTKLINQLFDRGKFQRDHYSALVKADSRAFPHLVEALLKSPDDGIRETCAEILADRRSAKAIPFLLRAVGDKCIFVRQDAFWAIERICGYEQGALGMWLGINPDDPTDMKRKTTKWWKHNKQFIEDNYFFK